MRLVQLTSTVGIPVRQPSNRNEGSPVISINYRDSRPIYEQVVDGIRKLVLTGALSPDDKLPSVRELASELAINPNTIQRAYRELEQQIGRAHV